MFVSLFVRSVPRHVIGVTVAVLLVIGVNEPGIFRLYACLAICDTLLALVGFFVQGLSTAAKVTYAWATKPAKPRPPRSVIPVQNRDPLEVMSEEIERRKAYVRAHVSDPDIRSAMLETLDEQLRQAIMHFDHK